MTIATELKFTSGKYSVYISKEVAKKLIGKEELTSDEAKKTGIFFGDPVNADPRFKFSINYWDGQRQYHFTSNSTANIIGASVFECFNKAVAYLKEVEADKPTVYGNFKINWNGDRVVKTAFDGNDRSVGKVYMNYGEPKIDLDTRYAASYNFPIDDIQSIGLILKDAKTKLTTR